MYGLPKRKHAADGGLIVGPGTGTSDSIEKTVPEGTYILPADTTQQLGFGMPRRNGQSAPAQEQPRLGMPGKQVPVAVSNGEYEMPPQDVHAVGAAVLDQLKNATHQQKGFGLTKAVMAAAKGQQADGPRQFFADGGLVDEEPRQGFGVRMPTTTLMQPEQPRLGMPTRKPSGQTSSTGSRVLDVPLGAAQAVAGAVRTPIAAGQDAIRNAAAYVAGGDPATLPGGSTRYRDEAVGQFEAGVERVGGALSGIGEAARSALGVQPRQEQPAEQPRLGMPRPQAEQVQAEQPRLGMPGRAGADWNQAGEGIAGRVGENDVPEFTNDPAAVAGAGTGSQVGSVGNGRGTLSVGQPGDSQLALDRFGRANDIRAQTIQESRRGQIGEGGGRVTVVRDGSRAPTRDDFLRARLQGMQAETDARQQQAGLQVSQDARQAQADQLNQQRLQQQIAESDLGMQDRQRLEQLRAQISDPNISEEQRNTARQSYNVLATQAKDRYIAQDVVLGQGNNGPVIGRQIIDVTTGQPVAQGGQQRRAQVSRAEIEQAAQQDGVSVDQYIRELEAMGVSIGA